MRKIYLLFFLMLTACFNVLAQSRTITGTITGKDDNSPLIGVTITVKGSSTATATDQYGKYSIKATSMQDVVLMIKYIGYKYLEVTIKPGDFVSNVQLEATNSSLNEVIVTGYGGTLKSKLLGSVGEIKAKDIEDVPVGNLAQALQDRVVGVGVNTASGKPGAKVSLTIRNPTTVFGGQAGGITTDPLYIIDGLVSTADAFNNLDASLVESISFLKDAQAAIYGAAGDKGVVLVTTKQGKPGKARISYTGYIGQTDITKQVKYLDALQEATLYNDNILINRGNPSTLFSQADLDYLANNNVQDWFSQLWHAAYLQRHTINISGGSDKITFFAGGSYSNEGGNVGTLTNTKYSIRSGLNAKISDELNASISLNTGYTLTNRNTYKGGQPGTEDITTSAIFTTPRWVPLTINGYPNDYVGNSTQGNEWNPLAYQAAGLYERTGSTTVNLNTTLEYRPKYIPGLSARVQFGKNNNSGTQKSYWPPSYKVYTFTRTGNNGLLYSNIPSTGDIATSFKNLSMNNRIYLASGSSPSYQLIGSLSYARVIKKHSFDVLFAVDQSEGSTFSTSVQRDGQQIPGIDQFNLYPFNTTEVATGDETETGQRSFVMRANYDYAGKYLLQFIARVDGSVNFAPEKRWGVFPSVSLGWRVSEEPWYQKYVAKYVNSLKIRANYGLVGDNRVDPYQYSDKFKIAVNQGYLFGSNSITTGIDPGIIPNPNITWEHQLNQNYGFDATFLNDRLSLTVDYYIKHTYDQFQDFGANNIPYTAGLTSGAVNYGITNNWGTEFSLGWNSKPSNKGWSWNASVNFSFTNNVIVQEYYTAGDLGTPYAWTKSITQGLDTKIYNGSNYGLISKGIIRTQADVDAILAKNPNYTIGGVTPQVGYMDFVDVNGDGKIDDTNDLTLMYPNGTGGLISLGMTYGVAYKTLKFSINGRLSLGGKNFVDGSSRKKADAQTNVPAFWADHWTPQTPDAKYPRIDAPYIGTQSTFWARSGNSLYINNATLSYALPKSLIDRLKIPDLRFLVSANNLWDIIEPFEYKDQRQGSVNVYPPARTISVGINLSL